MATKPRDIDVETLLGRPLSSAAVKAFIAATAMTIDLDEDDDVLAPGNDARGAHMELVRARDYNAEFATRAVAKRPTEWVVQEVGLYSKGTNTKKTRTYPGALPFGLAFGDTAESIIAKVGRKPSSKETATTYPHSWWFRVGDVKLLTTLDAKQRLVWLRVVPLDRETAQALARKAAKAGPSARSRGRGRRRAS